MTKAEYDSRVAAAKHIVFFGGAGVSTESGIPDFRSADGLYNQKHAVPPERILSADYFYEHTAEFFEFYFDKMIALHAKPNAAHYKLAEWERRGKCLAVVTQNIDGLHRAAGSKNVYELHGTTLNNACVACGREYSREQIMRFAPCVPYCECGGIIKPRVVLYGEALPDDAVKGALDAISRADMLIVAGTSLTVYPAASLVGCFGGDKDNLILINRTPDKRFKNTLIGNVGDLL